MRCSNNESGVSSGLYSQKDFEDGLRYYYCSLGRSKDGEQVMPKSITISGINNTQVAADYLVFVISAKSMTINCSTGKVIRS